MESEEDEESSNSILALSGSFMPQTVHSSTSLLPTNPRQPAWSDIQSTDLDVARLPSLASSLPRVQITSDTGVPTYLEASSSSTSTQKREKHHYNDHQNVQYKNPFNSGLPHAESQSGEFNIRSDKQHASKGYAWRAEDPLSMASHSTSGHSVEGQVNRTTSTNDSISSAARSGQGNGHNRLYFKKRPNDYQSSSSDLLYCNANSTSNHRREELFTGTNNRSMQIHSSSSMCQADSPDETNSSLQQVYVSTALDATRNMNPVSMSENNPNEPFLRDQAEQVYTANFSNFRTLKKPQESHEQTETLNFDHQQVMDDHEAKHEFDFSFNDRSFPPLSFATDFSNRNRSVQQLAYHEVSTAHNDLPAQSFFTGGSSTGGREVGEPNFCIPGSLNNVSKKKSQVCEDFGPDGVGQDLRIVEPSHRKTFENQALSATLEASLPGSYIAANDDLTNFRHQDCSNGSQVNLSSQIDSTLVYKNVAPLPEGNNSWMGRSRAHRKMARLLGNADQTLKHGSFNDPKPIYSSNDIQSTTELHHKNPSEQSVDDLGTNLQTNHHHSLKDHCNFSRDFLTFADDFNFKAGGNPTIFNSSGRSSENSSKKQAASSKEFFTAISSAATPNIMFQGSVSHSISDGTVSHRGMDLPIFNPSNTMPRDHALSNLPMASMNKNILDGDFTSMPIPKDSVVPGFFMNSQQPQQTLGCLDFAPSQRELDLSDQFAMQDPKDFGIDAGHVTEQQMDLSSFDQGVDSTQPDLTLTDSLSLGPHSQQDLNLEAYFNPQPMRDQNTNRKVHSQHSVRDISYVTGSAESEFNLDEYVNPSLERATSSSYLLQPNMPQDMTICQKPVSQKLTLNQESLHGSKQSQRQPVGRGGYMRGDSQEGEFSKLQRELTKTSSKESMKGIRNPRDIGRAMEILESLKADEREEQYHKEQEWKRQQHHLLQQQEHQHQQDQALTQQLQQQQQQQSLQLQHQQQGQGASLNSSPKKTFQNKHYFESLSLAMSEHQLLAAPENDIDDQTVGNFLDQSQLEIPDQTADNLQVIQSFQSFSETDASGMGGMAGDQYIKRDLNQPLTYDLDYHFLKKIALNASIKESKDQQASFSTMPDQPAMANLSDLLSESNMNTEESNQVFGTNYTASKKLPYSQKQGDFEDTFSKGLNSKDSLLNTTKSSRSRLDSDFPFPDLDVYHQSNQTKGGSNRTDLDTLEAMPNSFSRQANVPSPLSTNSLNCESVPALRQNMYTLMKAERFCDAILSTHKQTVKVHQLVLCSLSQYLSNLLHKMSLSASTASSGNSGHPSGSVDKVSYKPKLQSNPSHHSQLQSFNELERPANHHEHQQQNKENLCLPQHATVLLVVNCENIKANSLQTFLVYIYTGQLQLTESNVCDLFLLASSLRINCLKDKCRDFMQHEHISEDKLKIPELVLSSSMGGRHFQQDAKQDVRESREVRDKACDTADDQQEVSSQKLYEDKAVNTTGVGTNGTRRSGGHMEAATQTDRSTHEVGVRGSQEEWVMLKKTKQKTVSPSKSKSSFGTSARASSVIATGAGAGITPSGSSVYGPHGKLSVFSESLGGQQFHHIHKLGKKGWLSPKRRYKTELHQSDSKTGSAGTISASAKNGVTCAKEHVKVASTDYSNKENPSGTVEVHPSSATNDFSALSGAQKNMGEVVEDSVKTSPSSIPANKELERPSSDSTQNVTFPMVVTKGPLVSATKTTRTTVEIAEEAAAAKICAHSYGTRTARGAAKNPISYAALASGNRKKFTSASSSPSGSLVSKKKAFIKAISQPISSPDIDTKNKEDNPEASNGNHPLFTKSTDVDHPVQETSKIQSRSVMCPLKKNIVHRSESQEKSEKEGNYECKSLLPPPVEKAENTEKIAPYNDSYSDGNANKASNPDELSSTVPDLMLRNSLDGNESGSSSLSSTPQIQPNSSSSVSFPQPSCAKTKVVLQNFRKRLIHQVNSEQLTKAACSVPSLAADGDKNSQTSRSDSGVTAFSVPIGANSQASLTTIDKSVSVCATMSNSTKIKTPVDLENDTLPTENLTRFPDLQSESKSHTYIAVNSSSSSQSKNSSKPGKNFSPSQITSPAVSQHSQISSETSSSVRTSELVKSSPQTLRTEQDINAPEPIISDAEKQYAQESESTRHPPGSESDLQDEHKDQGAQAVAGTDHEEEIFTHKIFKRKKKMKVRKPHCGEADNSPASKCKKLLTSDAEASSTKPRHRKAASGSDTEGSTGRAKVRKTATTASNNSLSSNTASGGNSSGDAGFSKVRAPPKKRAKMELALLKAANLARRAIEERRSESLAAAAALSSLQQNLAERAQQQEETLEHQQETTQLENETVKTGSVLELKEKRSLPSLQKKVAKRKAIQETAAKPKEKETDDDDTKKNPTHSGSLKKQGKRKTVDATAALVSSLALKLRAKLKQYTLDLGEAATENLQEGKGTGERTEKESFTKFYSCSLCQLRLQNARRMVKHIRSHGTPDDQVLDAVNVGRFNQEYEACDICGYETKDKSYQYMHYHKYFRHGVPLPPGWHCNVCKICGKTSATTFQFKEHMLSHEQTSRFICWHCGQHFSSRSNFNSHVYHKHSDIRKHQCTVCSKGFKTRTQLKVHLRSHTGERPFKCPDCEYSSTTRGNMKAHLKSHNHPMDKINTLMAKIAERASELDVKSMDKVMKDIAEKVKNGELPAVEDTQKGSNKEGKRRKSPKSKPKIIKTEIAGAGVSEQPIKSCNNPLQETQSEKKKASTENVSSTITVQSKPAQESHIKRLLTAPLSSLTMPKFQLNFQSVVGSSKEKELQRNKPVHAANSPACSSKQEPLQIQSSKATSYGTTVSLLNAVSTSNVEFNIKTVEKGSSSVLLSTESNSVSIGVDSSQSGVATTSASSENFSESLQGFYQVPHPSSTTSVVQATQPFIIPLVNSAVSDQSQQSVAAAQQLQLPVQLLIAPDFSSGYAGALEIQQPILHTLPASAGSLQVLSGTDISNILTISNSGQVLQALSSAEAQLPFNTDTSQFIQILPAETPLPLSGSLGISAQSGFSQIVQLVAPGSGEISAANGTASGVTNFPVHSNYLESSPCLLQEMVSSTILPEINSAVSIASGLQDSGLADNVNLAMSVSASGEEQVVQQSSPINSQQQPDKPGGEVALKHSSHSQMNTSNQILQEDKAEANAVIEFDGEEQVNSEEKGGEKSV